MVKGKPDELPNNTIVANGPPVLRHLSFRLNSLDDLQKIYRRLGLEITEEPWTLTHGVFWAMYSKDPEGNAVEFFADTPWYVRQPYLKPMDFNIDTDTLHSDTETLLKAAPGFRPLEDFHRSLEERVLTKEDA